MKSASPALFEGVGVGVGIGVGVVGSVDVGYGVNGWREFLGSIGLPNTGIQSGSKYRTIESSDTNTVPPATLLFSTTIFS